MRPDHAARAVALQELKPVVWVLSKAPSPSLGYHVFYPKYILKSALERGKSARRYRFNSPPTRVKLLVLEMRGLN